MHQADHKLSVDESALGLVSVEDLSEGGASLNRLIRELNRGSVLVLQRGQLVERDVSFNVREGLRNKVH